MVNQFEIFSKNSIEKVASFKDIYKKFQEVPDDSKIFQEIGLEFSPDGYIVTIKKQSPAESQFAKIIQEKGDKHYKMDLKESVGKFYVFSERQMGAIENDFDLTV